MPSKNTVKKFVPDGIYHIYNRGVEKRSIFPDKKDYQVFLQLLKTSLSPEEERDYMGYTRVKDKSESLELIAYCLMPNHFHLLVKQLDETSMTEFMRSISNAYVAYFNKKYKRVGSLFQGTYKAVLVDRDEYLVHLSRYIHMNPLDINIKLDEYPYSSYKYYLDDATKPTWLNHYAIIEQFKTSNEYKEFVEDLKTDSLQIIKPLTLD
ncbi:MAG: transposase [bacterium]|nr:transposase [bacterium]